MIRGLLRQPWILHTQRFCVRKYVPRGTPLSSNNPGLGRRLKMFEKEDVHEEDLDMEDLESDFMNVHESHNDVLKEAAEHQHKLGYWIVKNKYFKSHNINLLTHSEKEQIRHLHDSDREEWTVEKLAASFPATEDTIRKLIKAKWLMRDPTRIDQHDLKVQSNWDALKENSIPGLDQELRQQLLKFADREIHQLPKKEYNRDLLKLPSGEFSNIITSCKKPEGSSSMLAIQSANEAAINHTSSSTQTRTPSKLEYGSDTFLIDEVTDRSPTTIELFLHSSGMLQKAKETSTLSTHSDGHQTLGSRTAKVELTPVPSQFEANKSKFQLRDQISIPRKLRRRGATYKVDDSYFDEDWNDEINSVVDE